MNFLSKKAPNLSRTVLFGASVSSKNVQNAMPLRFQGTKVPPKKSTGFFKLGLAGVTVGALVGTGYSIHQKNNPKDHFINEHTFIETVSEIPDIKPSRRVCIQVFSSNLIK